MLKGNEPLSTTEWEVALGRAMSKMRRARGQSQKDLAKIAGLSVSAIKKIEGGHGSTLRSLILIARALGRTDWLSSFATTEPTISPLDLFLEQEKGQAKGRPSAQQNLIP